MINIIVNYVGNHDLLEVLCMPRHLFQATQSRQSATEYNTRFLNDNQVSLGISLHNSFTWNTSSC